MGKQNRQRRAAKQRKRQGGGRTTGSPRTSFGGFGEFGDPPFDGGGGNPQEELARRIERRLDDAATLMAVSPDEDRLRDMLDSLERAAAPLGARALPQIAADLVIDEIHGMWHRGWQPADVVGVLHKHADDETVALAAVAIIDEATNRLRPDLDVPERWARQLDVVADALPATGGRERTEDLLMGGPSRSAEARTAALRTAVRLLGKLRRYPDLPLLMPDPCAWPKRSDPGASRRTRSEHLDPGLLDKVRALLAKAESTTFEAEALAFTAKAQELMARHAIDQALLDHDEGHGDEPEGCRVRIEDPYAGEKAMLLGVVAAANRSRTVWDKQLGFSTVFGFANDLDSIELLYTSLLVQANAAMLAHGPQRDRHGRSKTRSFRQSFLVGFATRVGQRLRQATDEVVEQAAAEQGGTTALVPVLAEREQQADDAMRATFPGATGREIRVGNHSGWVAGQVAGEQASLALGDPLPG
jgi:hypothetical protein